jgi:hypothetical protein
MARRFEGLHALSPTPGALSEHEKAGGKGVRTPAHALKRGGVGGGTPEGFWNLPPGSIFNLRTATPAMEAAMKEAAPQDVVV